MDVKKVKLSFGIFLLLLLLGVGISVSAQESSTSNQGIFNDSDQDGLSNEEEAVYGTDPNVADSDNDGYSDGTEVNTGYDPLKSAPGDKIVKDDSDDVQVVASENAEAEENITEQVAQEISATVASSEGGAESVTLEKVESMVSDVMNENASLSDLPEVDESQIKMKDQEYSKLDDEEKVEKIKKDNEEYLTELAYVAIENSPYKISSPSDLNNFENEIVSKIARLSNLNSVSSSADYFKNISDKGALFLEQAKLIEVPKDMVPLHKKGLQLMTEAVSMKDTVKVDTKDPIGSIISVSKVENLLSLCMDFQEEINNKFTELGLDKAELDKKLQ